MGRNRLGKRERERARASAHIDATECARESLLAETGNIYAGSTRKRDTVKRIAAVHAGEVRRELVTPTRPKVTDMSEIVKRSNDVARRRANARATGYGVGIVRGGTPLPPA